jgi:hypothetical protein
MSLYKYLSRRPRWLRHPAGEMQEKQPLREALPICATDPLNHRFIVQGITH